MLAARRSIGILYRPGRKCCSEQRPAVAAEARASQTGGFSLRAHEGGDFQLAQLRDMRARRVRAARPIDSSCIAFAAFPPRPFVLFSTPIAHRLHWGPRLVFGLHDRRALSASPPSDSSVCKTTTAPLARRMSFLRAYRRWRCPERLQRST